MHPNDNLAIHFTNVNGPRAKYILYMTREHESPSESPTVGLSSHRLTEFIYVSSGSGLALIDDKEYPLNAGDFYILNPGVLHDESLRHNDFQSYMSFYILGIENVFFADSKEPLYKPTNVADTRLPFLFKELRKESINPDPSSEKAVQLLFKLLLTDVNKILHTSSGLPKHNTLNQLVNQVQKYLDEHFAENIQLKDVANVFFCNESTLSHNFRKHLNCSIMEYVMKNRLECAKMWLQISNKSIAEIATISGFSTTSYFCEYFKKVVKQTPLQYRKAYHIAINTRVSTYVEE